MNNNAGSRVSSDDSISSICTCPSVSFSYLFIFYYYSLNCFCLTYCLFGIVSRHLSVRVPIYLFECLCACLAVCLSVCLHVSFSCSCVGLTCIFILTNTALFAFLLFSIFAYLVMLVAVPVLFVCLRLYWSCGK